jgi:hypothetical protein
MRPSGFPVRQKGLHPARDGDLNAVTSAAVIPRTDPLSKTPSSRPPRPFSWKVASQRLMLSCKNRKSNAISQLIPYPYRLGNSHFGTFVQWFENLSLAETPFLLGASLPFGALTGSCWSYRLCLRANDPLPAQTEPAEKNANVKSFTSPRSDQTRILVSAEPQ